ncbi:MAG: hypothetical protein ISR41_02785 [Puniceicoccaceae bacterium]|nr:hypothetical protein [Puniceicoccaceae bacterium]
MNDPQNENKSETLGATPSTDASASSMPVPDSEQVESAEAPKEEILSESSSFSEESTESKPNNPPVVLATPAEPTVKPTPAPVKLSMAPKPAVTEPQSSPVPDSSISIDGDRGPNVGALFVDAIAAAVAIAFTVLFARDVIPFL